jgi:hypothetical protein
MQRKNHQFREGQISDTVFNIFAYYLNLAPNYFFVKLNFHLA